MPENIQNSLVPLFERALWVAKQKFLSTKDVELGLIKSNLARFQTDLCTLNTHGILSHLLAWMLRVDKETVIQPPKFGNDYTQANRETLTELYLSLNNVMVLEDTKATFLRLGVGTTAGPGLTYKLLWQTIENSKASMYVGTVEAKPTLATILASQTSQLLDLVSQFNNGHDTITPLLHGHSKMSLVIPTVHKFFCRYVAMYQGKDGVHKLGVTQFLQILDAAGIAAADLARTEIWMKAIHALKLETDDPMVDTVDIVRFMSAFPDNLFNELCIEQGDNMQCLKLLENALAKDVGKGIDAYTSAYTASSRKKILLSFVMEQCRVLNLSDRFMSEHHGGVWKFLDWHVKHQGSSFCIVNEYYNGLKQVIKLQEQQVLQDQEKAERLSKVADMKKAFKCSQCNAPIQKDSLICLQCLEDGKAKCSICQGALKSFAEVQANMCACCIQAYDVSSSDIEEVTVVPVMMECVICQSLSENHQTEIAASQAPFMCPECIGCLHN